MSSPKADISENYLLKTYPDVLDLLLIDKTTDENILWATDNYAGKGEGFQESDHIEIPAITGKNGDVIQPRTYKAQAAQSGRTKEKAEVFTPSWVVNLQNNTVDDEWFGKESVFNAVTEDGKIWIPTVTKIEFPDTAEDLNQAQDRDLKTWQSYVSENRMEITCGEAPYLVSRYDTSTGDAIPIEQRVGILDRKLRIIEENVLPDHDHEEQKWFDWVKTAYKAIYGFEWQGDNLLIARENLLFTFFDVYRARYDRDPNYKDLIEIAEIIAWNIFQMDGLKYVIPNSCCEKEQYEESLFEDEPIFVSESCIGCAKGNNTKHNGVYVKTMDWENEKPIRFLDLLNT